MTDDLTCLADVLDGTDYVHAFVFQRPESERP